MQKITKIGFFIILAALISCTKDSTTEITSSTTSGTTTLKKDFSSAEDASLRVGGMTSSIITSRMVTGRIVTSRMADIGNMPSAAPTISSLDNTIQNLILSKMKSKVMKKITRFKAKEEINMDPCAEVFSSFTTCEEIKPECDLGGRADVIDCKTEQNRTEAKIKAENCKESGEENIDILYTGTGTIYVECSYSDQDFELKMGAKLEETTVTFYQGGNPIYKVEFSPSISYVLTLSSMYSTSAPRIDEKISFETLISLNVDGNVKETYQTKNLEQSMSFKEFKLSFSMKQETEIPQYNTPRLYSEHEHHDNPSDNPGDSGGDSNFPIDSTNFVITDFDFSISGRYTVSTKPSWCGDGEYVVQTSKPLKFKADSSCPYSGELQVNNAIVQFTGSDKVKIILGNSSKEYTCQELANSCPYDLENPLSLLPIPQ